MIDLLSMLVSCVWGCLGPMRLPPRVADVAAADAARVLDTHFSRRSPARSAAPRSLPSRVRRRGWSSIGCGSMPMRRASATSRYESVDGRFTRLDVDETVYLVAIDHCVNNRIDRSFVDVVVSPGAATKIVPHDIGWGPRELEYVDAHETAGGFDEIEAVTVQGPRTVRF